MPTPSPRFWKTLETVRSHQYCPTSALDLVTSPCLQRVRTSWYEPHPRPPPAFAPVFPSRKLEFKANTSLSFLLWVTSLPVFLNLHTTDIRGWKTSCGGACCRTSHCSPDLRPLAAESTHYPLSPTRTHTHNCNNQKGLQAWPNVPGKGGVKSPSHPGLRTTVSSL